MSIRVKVVFDDPEDYAAALAIENFPGDILAQNPVRRALSISVPDNDWENGRVYESLPANARVVPEVQYDLENGIDFDPLMPGQDIEAPKEGDLESVLDLINARDAWKHTKGDGVVLAVVDTGVNGSRPEFQPSRRMPGWAYDAQPWVDSIGHGTMCAAIAAGSRSNGGAADGIAPHAAIMPCRTRFGEVELSAIYDALTGMRADGKVIVATNSFGVRTGQPPDPDVPNLFVEALDDAINAGVHVFFSAGNYHELANGLPAACSPSSIWLHKCREDVMTVGGCDQDQQMWSYSSRGPGQLFGRAGMGHKPDVVAPTPRNGEILYGPDVRVLSAGWGTSGACPQAAGLAALLLSLEPNLSSRVLYDYIRETARNLGFAQNCQGAGMIDCAAAVERVR